MRSDEIFLEHILKEINFLLPKTQGLSFEEFMQDDVLKRASARSLEIIGEAVKNISANFKKKHKSIEWKKIAGMRDKLIHHYFDVNWEILWDVAKRELPKLKVQIEIILRETKVK